MAVEKKPPVGIENFEQIRRDGFSFKIWNYLWCMGKSRRFYAEYILRKHAGGSV